MQQGEGAFLFSVIFPHPFRCAVFEQFLHDGLLAALQPEDAAERTDVFARHRLKNDPTVLLQEYDAGAGLDIEPLPDFGGHYESAFG